MMRLKIDVVVGRQSLVCVSFFLFVKVFNVISSVLYNINRYRKLMQRKIAIWHNEILFEILSTTSLSFCLLNGTQVHLWH